MWSDQTVKTRALEDRDVAATRILFVEDDEVERRLVVRHLSRAEEDFHVIAVKNLAEAKAVLGSVDVQLAFVDQHLPDGEGIELLRMAPDTPMVMLTGTENLDTVVGSLREGARDYLVKAIDHSHLELLAPTILRVLGRAREDRDRRNQELRSLQRRYRELDQSLMGIAAILSAPLETLAHCCSLLKEPAVEEEPRIRESYLRAIENSANLALRTLRAMRRFTRDSAPVDAPAPVHLMDVVESATSEVPNLEDGQVATENLPVVQGDRGRLIALFRELLRNSTQYCSIERPLSITVTAEEVGPHWQITYTDNGIGIDPDEGQAIMELFQRGRRTESTPTGGVGLSICKRILEQHGSALHASPAPDSDGLRLRFTLLRALDLDASSSSVPT